MQNSNNASYNISGLFPYHYSNWDEYQYRLDRYEIFDGYYHNIAYHSVVAYSEQLKFAERLYKHVRGVYNPVARLVESYVSKVWGGVLDMQTAETGAIPIATENPILRDAIIQLWLNSRWGQKKSLYVRNGAKFGDTYLKIVDDMPSGMVYMEAVSPQFVRDVQLNANGSIERIVFEYYIRHRNPNVRPDVDLAIEDDIALYTEVITPEKYATYINGELAPVHTNARGDMVAEWDNEYGFVPVVTTMHRDVGLDYGGNAFYYSLHKINELNDLASILNDGARRQVNMPLFTFGQRLRADFGSDQSTSTTNRNDKPRKDTMSVVEMSNDARVEALPPVISISDTLQLIQSILEEIERDVPELSLARIRESSNLTAPGVRSAYDDAIARYQEARGNYDASLVEAQKMAVAIGGMRGYKGFEGFNLMSLDNGDLEHYINQRPVINDTLSKSEKIQLTLQSMTTNAPPPIYKEIGWSEDEIETIVSAQGANTTSFINQFGAPEDETPPETPEDTVGNAQRASVNETDLLAVSNVLAGI